MNTAYVPGRWRFAVAGAVAAAFVFGCVLIGVFSVRDTTTGLALICLLFCLVVYLMRPQWMVLVALFMIFAALPEALHIGKDIGPVTIYGGHVLLVLAICYLIPVARLRPSAYVVPGMFFAAVMAFAVIGFAVGNPTDKVLHELTYLLEMIGGFVLAMLIVRTDYVKETVWVFAVTLWFSAAMVIASSFHLVRLAGRFEQLEKGLGAAQASRLVTASETLAFYVLTALVAVQIVGRVRPRTYLVLAPPALIITLLAFARHALLAMGVAALVAFLASPGWPALRRTSLFIVSGAALLAVTVPGALFLLQHSTAGAWLGDQFTAFNSRVLTNISSSRFAMDPSILARLAENRNLRRAIGEAPVFGHGLGYRYQLPFGKSDSFEATLGTTYAHNFYLWWLAKTGAAGMTAFALFASPPVVRGLLSTSAPAKASAAVSVALLVVSYVEPLPEEATAAMSLGLALGAALGFATMSRPLNRAGAARVPAAAGTPT